MEKSRGWLETGLRSRRENILEILCLDLFIEDTRFIVQFVIYSLNGWLMKFLQRGDFVTNQSRDISCMMARRGKTGGEVARSRKKSLREISFFF